MHTAGPVTTRHDSTTNGDIYGTGSAHHVHVYRQVPAAPVKSSQVWGRQCLGVSGACRDTSSMVGEALRPSRFQPGFSDSNYPLGAKKISQIPNKSLLISIVRLKRSVQRETFPTSSLHYQYSYFCIPASDAICSKENKNACPFLIKKQTAAGTQQGGQHVFWETKHTFRVGNLKRGPGPKWRLTISRHKCCLIQ